jgi:hypothetical protein
MPVSPLLSILSDEPAALPPPDESVARDAPDAAPHALDATAARLLLASGLVPDLDGAPVRLAPGITVDGSHLTVDADGRLLYSPRSQARSFSRLLPPDQRPVPPGCPVDYLIDALATMTTIDWTGPPRPARARHGGHDPRVDPDAVREEDADIFDAAFAAYDRDRRPARDREGAA